MSAPKIRWSIITSAFVLMASAFTMMGAGFDTVPNDSYAQAEWIEPGSYSGYMDGVSDYADYYKFNVSPNYHINLSVIGSSLDFKFYLFDGNEVQLAQLGPAPAFTQYIDYLTPDDITYTICYLVPGTWDDADSYQFTLALRHQDDDAGSGGDAPDNSGAAVPVTPGTYSGFVEGLDSVDYYQFTAGEGDIIRLDFSALDPDNYLMCTVMDNELNIMISLLSFNNITTYDIYYTGKETVLNTWFIGVIQDGDGEYWFTLNISHQNDAGLSGDAPADTGTMSTLAEGTYTGHLEDMDTRDLYGITFDGGDIIEVVFTSYSTDDNITLYLVDNVFNYLMNCQSKDGVATSGEFITQNETDPSGWYLEIDQYGIGDYEFTITITPQNDAGSGDDANNWDTHDPSYLLSDGTYSGLLGGGDQGDQFLYDLLPSMVVEAEFATNTDNEYTSFQIMDRDNSSAILFLRSRNNVTESGATCIDGDGEPYSAIVTVWSDREYTFSLSHWFQNDSGSGRDAYSKDMDLQDSTPIDEGEHSGFVGYGDDYDNYRITIPSGNTLEMTIDPADELTTWTYIKDINGSEKASNTYSTQGSPSTLTYETGTEGGDYVISILRNSGMGAYSLSINITEEIPATVPGAPRNITATPGQGVINITWDAPASDGGSPITYYKLYRSDSEFGSYSFHSAMYIYGALEWSDDFNVVVGQTYYYKIAAMNIVGEGPNSSVVSAAALPLGDDADGDGMPDQWEDEYNFDKDDPSDAAEDKDHDGFTNLEEYQAGTDPKDRTDNPTTKDTDGDGMPDQWEDLYGLDKIDPTDAMEDLDNDGASNLEEYEGQTDPTDDTDVPDEEGEAGFFEKSWPYISCCCCLLLLFGILIIILIVVLLAKKKKGKGEKAKADKKDDEE